MNNIYLIVSVYNEAKYLPRLLSKLKQTLTSLPQIRKVIFVNDGSNDESRDILQEHLKKNHRYQLLNHKTNLGKGAAMDTGYKLAKKEKANGVIFMDADLQHDPFYLKIFVEKLKTNQAVFGYRLLGKNVPWYRRLGNVVVKHLIRILFNIKRYDILCGFFAFRKELFSSISWESTDYGVETEISTLVAKLKIDFAQVKISTIYHQLYKGVNLIHAFFISLKIPFWFFSEAKHLVFLSSLLLMIVFLPLGYREVFSNRTLIGNLEPFPDTMYYASPAWNFVNGKGLGMHFDNLNFQWITPPLYTLLLIIPFKLFNDVRSFYLLNLIFSLISVYLFTKLLTRLTSLPRPQKFMTILVFGSLLVTNFYFYTLPSFLLAENLTLVLTLLAALLLVSPFSKLSIVILAFLPLFLLMVKFANFGLAIGIGFAALLQLLRGKNRALLKAYLLTIAISVAIFWWYTGSSRIFLGHKNLDSNTSFTLVNFGNNLKFYVYSLLGKDTQLLWFRERLFNPILAFVLAGLSFLGLAKINNKARYLLSVLICQILFMSFFYVADLRFIWAVVPIWLALAAVGYAFISKQLSFRLNLFLAGLILITYLFLPGSKKDEPNYLTMRKQVVLNLKYSETPWNYLSVMEFNTFFKNRPGSYLATFLPPFYVDYFRSSKFNYLPITSNQDFINGKNNYLEQKNIKHPSETFNKLLKAKIPLYITNAYVNNLGSWVNEYEELKKQYNFILEHEGCLGSCDIYKLAER